MICLPTVTNDCIAWKSVMFNQRQQRAVKNGKKWFICIFTRSDVLNHACLLILGPRILQTQYNSSTITLAIPKVIKSKRGYTAPQRGRQYFRRVQTITERFRLINAPLQTPRRCRTRIYDLFYLCIWNKRSTLTIVVRNERNCENIFVRDKYFAIEFSWLA